MNRIHTGHVGMWLYTQSQSRYNHLEDMVRHGSGYSLCGRIPVVNGEQEDRCRHILAKIVMVRGL